MFWLLVFLAVAGTLAYRGSALPTATGVLGVTVLLYGWLGGSAGYFLLLLLGWLLLFVPLNTPALRQEWFTRPLLDHWLAQSPAPSALPEPGPAAVLLEGQTGPLPPPAVAAETPDADLRAEALAAALLWRLRRPLQAAEPVLAQARVAELLYCGAALVAQAPRLLAQEQPDSGLLARTAQAWPLAEQTAALLGLAPEARLDWAAGAPEAQLAGRLAAAHQPGRALQQAAGLESPAARLIAFDQAFWPLLGRLLSDSVRSLVGGFAALLPASPEDPDRRHAAWLALAGQRVAVLLHLRVLLQLFSRLPDAYEQHLARAVLALLSAQAALAWHGEARQPGGERALLESLLRRLLHPLEQELAAALRELRQPIGRRLLRVLLLPLPLARPPTQAEALAGATALLREPALRARLAAGLPAQDALRELDDRLEALRKLEPSLRRLRLARFETAPADDAALLASASRLGLLSEPEVATLSEALAFAAGSWVSQRGGEAA